MAETGSLVQSREGKPIQMGLLPLHHGAIVPTEKIYEKLDELFATFGDSPPTDIDLETGPSRTADIELTLKLRVHGPERLSTIVLEGQLFNGIDIGGEGVGKLRELGFLACSSALGAF